MSVELAGLVVIILFMLGMAVRDHYNSFVKSSVVLISCSTLLAIWVGVAAMSKSDCIGITYHPIIKQKMPDGTYADVIIVRGDDGRKHIVNINSVLGVSVPNDGNQYQVARMKYEKSAFGLLFSSRGSRYEVIRKPERDHNDL